MKDQLAALVERIKTKVKTEPVVVMYLILFAITGAAHFGFDLDPETITMIDGAVGLALTVWTRKRVSPLAKLEPMTPAEFVAEYGEGIVR